MLFRSVTILLIAAVAAGLSGCKALTAVSEEKTAEASAITAASDVATDSDASHAIVRGEIGDASVLLPVLACDTASTQVTDLIFNGLLRYDKDINFVGDLAERWEISDDKLTIRFFLRKGVTWHDGVPFTAEDVEHTYRVYVDPKTPAPLASAFMRIDKLRVLDPHTVEVTYREPYAPALASWVINKILPKHLLDGKDITSCQVKRNPVGTGPYKFVEWKTGEKIVLEANPDYFFGKPHLQGVVFRIVPNQAAMFLELKAGGVDRMQLTPLQYGRQTCSPWFQCNFRKYRYADFGYVYLGYNLRNEKFADKRVRQAFAMALDREGIVAGALLGLAQVANGPFKPDSFWHNPHAMKWPHDPKKASELLEQAGWTDTDGDGILDKDGEPFEFVIITNQGNESRRLAAMIIQRDLKQVGIKVHIRILEWAAFLKDFLDKRRFDAYLCGWLSEMDPDPTDQWHSTKTGENQFNHVGYCNQEVDRLLAEGASTHDRTERKRAYDRFQEILAEDQPVTFLWVIESLNLIHARFCGIEVSPMGIDHNFELWYVPAASPQYCLTP